jgi:hypothetical protein
MTVAETTVPIVIMDAQGNLITVTPTPTPFPHMSGTSLSVGRTSVQFPWKAIAIGVVVIAVLGTRYMMLKSRGLRGGNLALEFVPGVSDFVDKMQRKGRTKIEETPVAQKGDYSNTTSFKAAEAAREAQLARAEFAKAQAERKQMAAMANNTAPATPTGLKAPVKRPSSAAAQSGIKTAPGFKFTAPVMDPLTADTAPSPFKPSASAAASKPATTSAEVNAQRPSPFARPNTPADNG